jgi:hypothetical protein
LHRLNRLTVPIGERQHGTLTPGQEYFVEVEINPFSANRCSSSPIFGNTARQALQLASENRQKRV